MPPWARTHRGGRPLERLLRLGERAAARCGAVPRVRALRIVHHAQRRQRTRVAAGGHLLQVVPHLVRRGALLFHAEVVAKPRHADESARWRPRLHPAHHLAGHRLHVKHRLGAVASHAVDALGEANAAGGQGEGQWWAQAPPPRTRQTTAQTG